MTRAMVSASARGLGRGSPSRGSCAASTRTGWARSVSAVTAPAGGAAARVARSTAITARDRLEPRPLGAEPLEELPRGERGELAEGAEPPALQPPRHLDGQTQQR